MGSTLGYDETHAALVGGYEIKFKNGETTLEAVAKLEAQVEALNEKNSWSITLFVPGDTVYGGPEHYGSLILGRPLLMVSAWDTPTPFDPSTFAGRYKNVEQMTDDDKQFLIQTEGIEIESVDDLKVHLLSGGPLCYGAVHVGVHMDPEDEANAKYTYASNQNMEQEWGEEGLDGVNITSVEFTDHEEFDHSAESIAKHLAEVPNLENPKFFLLCRYD